MSNDVINKRKVVRQDRPVLTTFLWSTRLNKEVVQLSVHSSTISCYSLI